MHAALKSSQERQKLEEFVSRLTRYVLRGAWINAAVQIRIGATYRGIAHWPERLRTWKETEFRNLEKEAKQLKIKPEERRKMFSAAWNTAMEMEKAREIKREIRRRRAHEA